MNDKTDLIFLKIKLRNFFLIKIKNKEFRNI